MTDPTGSSFFLSETVDGTAHVATGALNVLSLAIVFGLLSMASPLPPAVASVTQTSAVNMQVVQRAAELEADLLLAISGLHDHLIAHSRELPHDAALVLYSNLWRLYQD